MKKTDLALTFEIPYTALTLGPKLGEGGFGTVYQATYLAAEAAVKQLKTDTLTPQVKEEFLTETAIMAQLHHPNIVQLYGVCLQPYAIVMEYMPQGSLFSLIHSEKDLSWALRYRIGIDIAKGIHFLHSKNIVHRDLKSLNVLVKPDCVKLCDFGLARVKTESSSTTMQKKSGAGPGTTRWKAPELFKRGQSATAYSDVYSYGVILWEMAARKIPYQEEHDEQTVISWIKDGEQETIPEATPKPYRQAIEAAWQLKASERPTALALVETLKDGQEEENKAKVLAPVKATVMTLSNSDNGQPESLSPLASLEPQYQSSLMSDTQSHLSNNPSITLPIPSQTKTSKPTLTNSGPQYTSQLPSQAPLDTPVNPGKQEITTSGPQYLSSLSGIADLTLTAPTTKANQLSPAPAHDLPLVQYQDTPEDIVKAATAMLRAKEWSSEQKAYFEELIQTVSLPPLQVLQGHTADVYALSLLPNGLLASGSDDKTIKLWDLDSGTCKKTLQGHTNRVNTLLVLPNGLLASGSSDKTIKVWDLTSGTCIKTLEGHNDRVTALLALPNGLLASGSGSNFFSQDNSIKLWDLTSGTCKNTLQGHTHCVKTLLVLPNGLLASGSWDNTIKLWNLTSGTCKNTLQGHTHSVNTLLVLPNGLLASGSSDKTIKVWDLTNRTCLKTLTTQHPIQTLRLLDNAQLFSNTGDEIQCWRLDNGQCIQRYGGLTGGYIHDLLPLASNEWIATSSSQIQRFSLAPTATLREGLTGARQELNSTGHYGFFKHQALSQLKRVPKTLNGHKLRINTLLVLPNGLLASGSTDDTIKIWDLNSGTCKNTLQGHTNTVNALLVLPNGLLASGSSLDKTIKIWDLNSETCKNTLQGHTNTVNALLVLPNGLLASGSLDKTIKIWDFNSGTCTNTLQGHTDAVNTLLVLPNGLLASGSWDKTIKIWDLNSGTCKNTLQGHTHSVNTLLMLPNGLLASGSWDTTIKFWDLTSGTCKNTLQGHTHSVNTLLMLPNGLLASASSASGSGDHTIKLWELTSGNCKMILGHTSTVTTLLVLPNGLLATASGSGDHDHTTIKLWNLDLTLTLEELEQKAPECKMM